MCQLLKDLEYPVGDGPNEELLCTILRQETCAVPPQLHRDLVRLAVKLKRLVRERQTQFDDLAGKIERMTRWLSRPPAELKVAGHLSARHLDQLRQRVEKLAEDQRAQCDVVLARKLECLHEYCKALNVVPVHAGDALRGLSTGDKLALIELVDAQMEELRPRYEASASIRSLIEQRDQLVQRMKAFEVSASDPARLFQPSFRLLQEEKFRKTAVPSLLRLEEKLLGSLRQWSGPFGYDGHPDYEQYLQTEIAGRYVNETVFGFYNSHSGNQNAQPPQGGSDRSPAMKKTRTHPSSSSATTKKSTHLHSK